MYADRQVLSGSFCMWSYSSVLVIDLRTWQQYEEMFLSSDKLQAEDRECWEIKGHQREGHTTGSCTLKHLLPGASFQVSICGLRSSERCGGSCTLQVDHYEHYPLLPRRHVPPHIWPPPCLLSGRWKPYPWSCLRPIKAIPPDLCASISSQ